MSRSPLKNDDELSHSLLISADSEGEEQSIDNADPFVIRRSDSFSCCRFTCYAILAILLLLLCILIGTDYKRTRQFLSSTQDEYSRIEVLLKRLENERTEDKNELDHIAQKIEAPTGAPAIPRFIPRKEVADIDCGRVLRGDEEYAKSVKNRKLVPVPPENIDMSCEGIRSRILPARMANEGFPVAYAKIVYTDYEFLEGELATNYAAENWYCFALDSKAPISFRRHFVALETCLPNVVLINAEYNTDSAGHFENHAHFDCVQLLRQRKWEYFVFLQNHDVMLKTHGDIVSILKALDGADDMELMKCPGDGRCANLEMNLGNLTLCPKSFSGEQAEACRKASVVWGKGSVQVSLSRRTSLYILENINYTALRDELNHNNYGIDEILVQTLVVTRELGLPGGYPPRCLPPGPQTVNNHVFMTRLSHWGAHDPSCPSGNWRHSICVFGIQDLPYLARADYIMANKMIPDTDYGIVSCISELLFNRSTKGQVDAPLNMKVYENMPLVQFNKGLKAIPDFYDTYTCPKTSSG